MSIDMSIEGKCSLDLHSITLSSMGGDCGCEGAKTIASPCNYDHSIVSPPSYHRKAKLQQKGNHSRVRFMRSAFSPLVQKLTGLIITAL